MYSFAAILDTRPRGSRHGVARACTCGRSHRVWVCFREVQAETLPGSESTVRYVPTGKVLVTGVGCATKVLVPVWESHRVATALEDPQRVALHPDSTDYAKFFQEFR